MSFPTESKAVKSPMSLSGFITAVMVIVSVSLQDYGLYFGVKLQATLIDI